MRLRSLGLGLLILLISGCATQYPVRLGDSLVLVKHYQHGEGKHFVHLHQNETTALKAAKTLVAREGGSYLTLVHRGERNIVFRLDHQRYEFDPNRIFTDVGIRKTLSQFGTYSPQAHREVKKLAMVIKSQLPAGKIIAVHNNKSYSFKDYLPGHPMSRDAHALAFCDRTHYRNFFLVTKKHDYLRLKRLQFNSVLQATSATDDGSLSVYLAHRDYINVEAGYHQLQAQIKMLKSA